MLKFGFTFTNFRLSLIVLRWLTVIVDCTVKTLTYFLNTKLQTNKY